MPKMTHNDRLRAKSGLLWVAFGVLYVFAVVLYALSPEKRGFLARFVAWGVSLIGQGAFKGF
jgi:hypothetical protein